MSEAGMKGRCAWCGASGRPLQDARIDEDVLRVCSAQCGADLARENRVLASRLRPFFVGIGAALVLLVGSAALQATVPALRWLLPAGLVLLGATVVWAPIVTPQTVTLFGLQRGMAIGRGMGVLIALGGLALVAAP